MDSRERRLTKAIEEHRTMTRAWRRNAAGGKFLTGRDFNDRSLYNRLDEVKADAKHEKGGR